MGTRDETGARSQVHGERKGALVGKQREWGEPAVASKYERKQGGGPPAVAEMWELWGTQKRGEGRGGAPTSIRRNNWRRNERGAAKDRRESRTGREAAGATMGSTRPDGSWLWPVGRQIRIKYGATGNTRRLGR